MADTNSRHNNHNHNHSNRSHDEMNADRSSENQTMQHERAKASVAPGHVQGKDERSAIGHGWTNDSPAAQSSPHESSSDRG